MRYLFICLLLISYTISSDTVNAQYNIKSSALTKTVDLGGELIAISQDGTLIVEGKNKINLVDIGTLKHKLMIPIDYHSTDMTFNHWDFNDHNGICTMTQNGDSLVITVWDLKKLVMKKRFSVFNYPKSTAARISLSEGGNYLILETDMTDQINQGASGGDDSFQYRFQVWYVGINYPVKLIYDKISRPTMCNERNKYQSIAANEISTLLGNDQDPDKKTPEEFIYRDFESSDLYNLKYDVVDPPNQIASDGYVFYNKLKLFMCSFGKNVDYFESNDGKHLFIASKLKNEYFSVDVERLNQIEEIRKSYPNFCKANLIAKDEYMSTAEYRSITSDFINEQKIGFRYLEKFQPTRNTDSIVATKVQTGEELSNREEQLFASTYKDSITREIKIEVDDKIYLNVYGGQYNADEQMIEVYVRWNGNEKRTRLKVSKDIAKIIHNSKHLSVVGQCTKSTAYNFYLRQGFDVICAFPRNFQIADKMFYKQRYSLTVTNDLLLPD